MNNTCIELIKYFNETTSFEKVTSLNEWQTKQLIASLAIYGADKIKSAFARADSSRFLTGNKGYEWKADFAWIINPDHLGNILKGKYDDFKKKNCPPYTEVSDSLFDDEFFELAAKRAFEDFPDNDNRG